MKKARLGGKSLKHIYNKGLVSKTKNSKLNTKTNNEQKLKDLKRTQI